MTQVKQTPLQPSAPAHSFTERELTEHLLNLRGNARLRLAAALAEEAGLSFEDICTLTPECFDFVERQLVAKTTDGEIEYVATFGYETFIEFFAWMKVRSDEVDDGCFGALLHDDDENPMTPANLRAEFSRVLCRSDEDTHHRLGLASFSESILRSEA